MKTLLNVKKLAWYMHGAPTITHKRLRFMSKYQCSTFTLVKWISARSTSISFLMAMLKSQIPKSGNIMSSSKMTLQRVLMDQKPSLLIPTSGMISTSWTNILKIISFLSSSLRHKKLLTSKQTI